MKAQDIAVGLWSQATKLTLLFTEEETRVLERLDELHRNLPATLPKTPLFRH